MSLQFHFAEKTDKGRIREKNEDFLWAEVPSDAETLAYAGALFVIADGLGGMARGDEASRTAIEEMQKHLGHRDHLPAATWLHQSVQAANTRIYSANQKNTRENWMATTLTASCFQGSRLTIAHVGDSRAYRVRNDALERLTKDHSFGRHTLTRAVGTDPRLVIDVYEFDVKEGDVYLQCSDGLYSFVDEKDLRQIMSGFPPKEACDRLVDMANQNGGGDNISVQIIRAVKGAK